MNRLAKLTPSRVVAVAVLLSVPAKSLTEKLADPDLWWHLHTGKLIVATHHIPSADPYSYSVPGKAWVVQEWLSEIILHALRDLFGLWGIFFWRALMLTAVYLVVARLIHQRMGEGMGTWALVGVTAYAGSANWTERPNLFSFLLFGALLTLIERKDERIWWFVPMAALWANLHGMVVLGIGTVAVVAAAEGLKAALAWEGADGAWAKRLGLVTLASLGATFLNPRGPHLIVYSLRLVRTVSTLVTEWASPDFHQITSILFLALLLVTIAALAMHPKRPDPTDLALALAFTVLGLQAARNLALAAIVLGFVASRYIPGAIEAARTKPPAERPVAAQSAIGGALGLVLAIGGLAIVVAGSFPQSGKPAYIVDREYPLGTLATLDGRPGVRVFAFDVWADYLIDRSSPDLKVYHDTRVDLYGPEQTRRYARAIAGLPGWRQTLDGSCTTHVLVRPKRDPLAEVLRLTSDWRIERENDFAVVFVRIAPAPGCDRYPIPRI
jgi:hypothetical protein